MRRALLLLAALALGACARPAGDPTADAGPLLPGLAQRLPTLHSIELRTAGDAVAVTLDRAPSGWVVRERTGWPADPVLVRTLLDDLAGARRVEAKTAKPDRYARIGVEPVKAADAGGVEVRLHGKDWDEAVVVGTAPPAAAGRFVRRAGESQAWQVDRALEVARDPAAWLETRLLDVPLAHVQRVRSVDGLGHAFTLEHRDDRFRVAGVPSAAMGDSYRGDTLAGMLEDLRFEDVAPDDGGAVERRVEFALADGSTLRLEAWRVDGHVWVRLGPCSLAATACADAGAKRRFLLPAHVAAKLLVTRDQILSPEPPRVAPAPPHITQEAMADAVQRALKGEASAPPAEPADRSR